MRADSVVIGAVAGALVALVSFGACFLVGSFIEATTDIRAWSFGVRLFIGLLGGVVSAAFGVASGMWAAENNE